MRIAPRYVGLTISAMTAVVTSVLLTFVGLALNYGFHPDFLERWAKAAALGYVTTVPVLLLVVPRVQRFVLSRVG